MHHRPSEIGPSFFPYGHNGYLVPVELLEQKNNASNQSESKYYTELFRNSIVKRNITWIALVKLSNASSIREQITELQAIGASAVIFGEDEGNLKRKDKFWHSSKIDIPSTFITMDDYFKVLLLTDRFRNDGFLYAAIDCDTNFEPNLSTFSLIVGLIAFFMCFCLAYHLFGCLTLSDQYPYKFIQSSKDLEAFPEREYRKPAIPPFQNNWQCEQDKCCICLDYYETGAKIRKLPCQHLYHSHCIDMWLLKMSILCPLCKRDVTAVAKEAKILCEK